MSIPQVLHQYALGPIQGAELVVSGLMHQTWFVGAEAGEFVLQRLHHKLSTQAILNDYAAVTEHLAAQGQAAPRLVPTAAGQRVAVDADGAWWRLTTRVPGHTRSRVTCTAEAEQGARALGRFHRAVANIEHRFESDHPLHDTAGHLARLQAAMGHPRFASQRHLVADAAGFMSDTLPTLMLPPDLPRRVVHGDPKISN
ncbi:MAG: phosphotransferase, partial [Myxococcales bacterium]|nr:phosphotransferase [Myxococcales bacterium]